MANMAPSMEVVNSSLQPQCDPLKDSTTSSSNLDSSNNTLEGAQQGDDSWDNNNIVNKPGQHDVLLGRGGGTNNHAGNVKFRKLVNEHKMRYLACSKVDKPKVAREVVQLWRKMDPPGRFLARKDETKRGPGSIKSEDNVWFEVGDKKANAKASQCLRERTPDVMPYLRQLREQQDLNTEHGVRLVRQHQMEMQDQQYRMQQQQGGGMQGGMGGGPQDFNNNNPAFNGGPAPPSPYERSQSLVMNNNNNGNNMMSPNNRRMSMPSMQQQPNSPYAGAPGQQAGDLSSPHQRRTSIPNNGNSGGPQQAFYMDEPGTPSNNGSAVSANGGGQYQGDMTDLEYEQHMMIMQQQLQMQQMQLQRMQQQRVTQRQTMHQQQQHLTCMSPMANNGMSPSKLGQQQGQFSQQMQQAISPPGLVGSSGNNNDNNNDNVIQPQAAPSSPAATKNGGANNSTSSPTSVTANGGSPGGDLLPVDDDPLQDLTQNVAGAAASGSSSSARNNHKASKRKEPTRGVPDRNPSFMSLGEEGELTLEEYRQQLEEYILNNQITSSNENNGFDEEDDGHDDDDDEDHLHSDLEDDWEKEKEKAYRQHPERGGGLDRNNTKSACSFMSVQTNTSMLSGISAFSDLMSTGSGLQHVDDDDDDDEQQPTARAAPRDRSSGVDRAVSGASMLSMMSELTDLSQNVDNLSLYDD